MITPYLYSEVTPGIVHFRYGIPCISNGVVFFCSVHPGDTIEAAHGIDTISIGDYTDATTTIPHGSYHGPLVGGGIIILAGT